MARLDDLNIEEFSRRTRDEKFALLSEIRERRKFVEQKREKKSTIESLEKKILKMSQEEIIAMISQMKIQR